MRRCLRVHSGSREFTLARLVDVEFIWVRVGSLGRSSCLFGFAWVHSRALSGCRVHPGSHAFTRARILAVGYICVRVGSLGRALVSSGSFRFGWVHSYAHWCNQFHWGSCGFIPVRQRVVGSFGFACVHSRAPRGLRVHPGSRGITR